MAKIKGVPIKSKNFNVNGFSTPILCRPLAY
jgi:hypothetical protein